MTLFRRFRNKFGLKRESRALFRDMAGGDSLTTKDTQTAINDLSRVVRNNPDAVEIYLALGNLYRSRGDIERALHIRQNIIARPNLDAQFKARAWYELGIDFKRAGLLDRALSSLENARLTAGDEPAILRTMASIFAESKDYRQAAEIFSQLHDPIPQAHYLVLGARDADSRDKQLERALKIYPPSPEAWLEKIRRDVTARNWKLLEKDLCQGLERVAPRLSFVLLQGLVSHVSKSGTKSDSEACSRIVSVVGRVLAGHIEDSLLHYYHAVLSLKAGDNHTALQGLEKSLVLDPEFWPARLELLSISAGEQDLTSTFKTQLDFFLEKARLVKRFVCTHCGLKREQVFFVCPRCHSWHSIAFRIKLND
ncbi:MAG: tetratricopeptide repeat protein [Desulfonatronovibrionaceae bacterium]